MEINVIWIEDTQNWQKNQERRLKEELPDIRFKVNWSKRGEGLGRYLKKPIDFVLCDYNLKPNDKKVAISLVKDVRKKNKYCKIIFYSGYLGTITTSELLELTRRNVCRIVDKRELRDIIKEEISHGITVFSIIDKWLSFYGKDKEKLAFSVLGSEFKNKRINKLINEVRRGTRSGQKLTYEITKYMLSMIVD